MSQTDSGTMYHTKKQKIKTTAKVGIISMTTLARLSAG